MAHELPRVEEAAICRGGAVDGFCGERVASCAVPVTFNFSGVLSYVQVFGTPSDHATYDLHVGDPFSGTFSYDAATGPDYTDGYYSSFIDPSGRVSLTVGSETYDDSFVALGGTPQSYQLVIADRPNGAGEGVYDNYFQVDRQAQTYDGGYPTRFTDLGVHLDDRSYTPRGILPAVALPTSLDLAAFLSSHGVRIARQEYAPNSYFTTYALDVRGDITSLSVATVPEPGTLALSAIGCAGLLLAARRTMGTRRTVASGSRTPGHRTARRRS